MSPRRRFARSSAGLPLLPLAAAVLTAVLVAACGSQAAPNAGMPPPPEVSVATVVSKNVRQWDEFNGRVSAVETVELRPRVSGYVERVAYQEGQEVRKGDLLFVIDTPRYSMALEEASARINRCGCSDRLISAMVPVTAAFTKGRSTAS